MLYASAKDALGRNQVSNLMALKKTGTTDRVNIVAESGLTLNFQGAISTPTLRMVLSRGTDNATLDSDIVSMENNVDMGDWRKAAAFIKWAKTNYPAKRYVFIPFGHGNGFLDHPRPPSKSTLLDKQTGNYVTIPEFGRIFKETGRVDVLLYLSCLMQTAEAAYEIKDYTDVIVGSEDLMSSIGYDMDLLASTLDSDPGIGNTELAVLMSRSYINNVKAHPKEISGAGSSVILTSRLGEFSSRLDAWVDAVMAIKDKDAAVKARDGAVRFDINGRRPGPAGFAAVSGASPSADLYDFIGIYTESLQQDTPERLLARQRGEELMAFLSAGLFADFDHTGVTTLGYDFSRTHGLAIHVPPVVRDYSYQDYQAWSIVKDADLAFARDGKWKTFLDWLYSVK